MCTTKSKKVRATRTTPTHATVSSSRGKSTMDELELARKLLYADTEEDVIEVLKAEGYWEDQEAWRFYGDNENNFATIGNQQAQPEAALAEGLEEDVQKYLDYENRIEENVLQYEAITSGEVMKEYTGPPVVMAENESWNGNGGIEDYEQVTARDLPLTQFAKPSWITDSLAAQDYKTLGDIEGKDAEEIHNIEGVGPGTLKNLNEALKAHKLKPLQKYKEVLATA